MIWRSVFRVRQSKLFIVFLVYVGVAVFIVPYIGIILPYSVFYNSSPKTDREANIAENFERVQQARRVLKQFNRSVICHQHVINPEFCFVVLSVSRPSNVNYLTQVVASLLPQISCTNSVFTVYNAEGPTHFEAMNLSTVVPVDTLASATSNGFAKEKEDYVHALEWCHQRAAKFSVILEDDALPHKDFANRLNFVLHHRMSRYDEWAFLKLYYPEKWEGWGNERLIILELILTSTLGGATLSLLIYILCAIFRNPPTHLEGVCFLFLSFVLSLYMLLALGRPHWLSLRSLSPHLSSVVAAPGCCTPAVVYPRDHLPGLIEYLKHANCSPVFPMDLALDKFASSRHLHRLLVIPNMVKHIGFVSSLGKKLKNPRDFRIRYFQ